MSVSRKSTFPFRCLSELIVSIRFPLTPSSCSSSSPPSFFSSISNSFSASVRAGAGGKFGWLNGLAEAFSYANWPNVGPSLLFPHLPLLGRRIQDRVFRSLSENWWPIQGCVLLGSSSHSSWRPPRHCPVFFWGVPLWSHRFNLIARFFRLLFDGLWSWLVWSGLHCLTIWLYIWALGFWGTLLCCCCCWGVYLGGRWQLADRSILCRLVVIFCIQICQC